MTVTVKGIDNVVTDLRALADFLSKHAAEIASPSEAHVVSSEAARVSAEAARWILERSGALDDSWQQVDALRVAAEEMTDRLVARRVAQR